MDFNFWNERWSTGRIGFHEQTVNADLERFVGHLYDPHATGVLVPLCGKSYDLTFLSERFQRVVGVEFVETAVQSYFEERGLSPLQTRVDDVAIYSAERVSLVAGDFHAVTLEHTGPLNRAFDRASIIALPPDVRPRYAAHLASLMPPGGRILMVTLSYDAGAYDGPPFSVSTDEVHALYDGVCDIERLDHRLAMNVPDALQGHTYSTVWLLTKR
jgi:thiopurine S-methyltransferase